MKAALLEKINHPIVLKDVKTTPLKVGQVLVKVLVSGLCGSQLHELNGNKGNSKFLPHMLGHEGCGIVHEVGYGVTNVKPGDKVVMHWRPGLGIDSEFPIYCVNGKEFSSGKVNTLSEFSIVSENRLTRIPFETDNEFAALLGCSLSTSLSLIEKESQLLFGETVLIIGCGGLGMSLISAARARGAGEIIVIDRAEEKRKMAVSQGANEFFSSMTKFSKKIDLIIDTTGNTEILDNAFSALSGVGRLILVGQPKPSAVLTLTNAIQLFNGSGQVIRASQGGGMVPQIDIPRYVKMFGLGLISCRNLVTHRYNLNEVNSAFDLLKSGFAGRIIIEIGV